MIMAKLMKKSKQTGREASTGMQIKSWKVLLFLGILVFAVYGNTIPNRFALDDDMVTQHNTVIKKGIKGIPEILKTRYATYPKQNYEYRPLVKITFAIEHSLFKGNPHVSHAINVLLYLLLCSVIYLLLRKLLRSYHPLIPLLATALFIVHPVHTEVVASLKNRDEIMSMLGGLMAMWAMIKFTENKKWWWIPVGLFFFAFGYFSKSSVLVFLALIPLTLYFFTNTKWYTLVMITLTLLIILYLARVLPRIYLPPTEREILYFENPLYYEKGFWIRIGTALTVVLFYLRLLVFPHPLVYYYGYDMIPVSGPGNVWSILSLLILLAMLFAAIKLIRKKHLLSYSILFFLLSISMYANLIKPPPGIVAERFLMVPSLAFCLALPMIAFMIFRINSRENNISRKQLTRPLILIAVIMIPFMIKTISRNRDWKDFETLYTHDIRYLENSAKANSVLAAYLSDKIYATKDQVKAMRYAEQSVKYYKQAISVYRPYATCWNNLGIIHYRVYRDTPEAIRCWKEAALHDSLYADPMYNIAITHENEQRTDSAILYYRKAISRNPDFTYAYSNLANLHYKTGDLAAAIRVNQELIIADPASDIPYVNIGNYRLLQNDTANAIIWWEKAIEKQPMNRQLNSTLAKYYRHLGNTVKAEYYDKLALKADQYLKKNKQP